MREDIYDAITRGEKINAIRLHRMAYGTSLREAKEAIDWAMGEGFADLSVKMASRQHMDDGAAEYDMAMAGQALLEE